MKRPIDLLSVAWGITLAWTYVALQCQTWITFGVCLILAILLWLAMVTREKKRQRDDKFRIGDAVFIHDYPGLAETQGFIICKVNGTNIYLVGVNNCTQIEPLTIHQVPDYKLSISHLPRVWWSEIPSGTTPTKVFSQNNGPEQ